MPCQDYGPEHVPNTNVEDRLRERCNLLARIACKALDALKREDKYNEAFDDPEIAKWYPAHKKADAARRQKEKAAAVAELKKKEARAVALAKLSAADREALGLPAAKRKTKGVSK